MLRVQAFFPLAALAALAVLTACGPTGGELDEAEGCASAALAPDVLGDAVVLGRAAREYAPSAKERRAVTAYWLILIESQRRGEAHPALLTAGFEAFLGRLGTKYASLDADVCVASDEATSAVISSPVACSDDCRPPTGDLLATLMEAEEAAHRLAAGLVANPAILAAIDELQGTSDADPASMRGSASLDVLSDAIADQRASEVLGHVGAALLAAGGTADDLEGVGPVGAASIAEASAVIGGVVSVLALQSALSDLRAQYDSCKVDQAARCEAHDPAPDGSTPEG